MTEETMAATEERVVMTPKCKTADSTTLVIERRAVRDTDDKMHVAGGDHAGIVINKGGTGTNDSELDKIEPHLSLEFRVFLVNGQTGGHTRESRTLRFWFANNHKTDGHAAVAQDFFRELVSPQQFPRDYVGFIKKIMKQMQNGYQPLRRIEVELRQLSGQANENGRPGDERRTVGPPTAERVLELVESAYPNPVTARALAEVAAAAEREEERPSVVSTWTEANVGRCLDELRERGLVREAGEGGGAFARAMSIGETRVTEVGARMPAVAGGKQPTVAIVTALYCEKLAVDAMLDERETFVRYTTLGESNVYTLGRVGAHRVVCTKLPTVGHAREAATAAGGATTRLLGTFQRVEHVLLVGVGGGVPHYTDHTRHVRLGDVVVAPAYVYCESVREHPEGKAEEPEFDVKKYAAVDGAAQRAARLLFTATGEQSQLQPWSEHMQRGIQALSITAPHQSFAPPPADSDKLYMHIGERDVIEVEHPRPPPGSPARSGGPRIHLAPVAAGRRVARDDRLRQQLAARTGALAFDCEFDAVIESVLGNCRDSFVCVRGIADYKDGTRRRDWQPYAALAAAAVARAIILAMEPPSPAPA